MMTWEGDAFQCSYCSKKFENDPIKLAVHIKENHEKVRGKLK